MCCPSTNKVIKGDSKGFSSYRRVTRRQGMRHDTLQAIAPTNVKTVDETSLFNIESNLDRLRLLAPTTPVEQTMSRIGNFDPNSAENADHTYILRHAKIRKIVIPRYGGRGLELVKPARELASSRPEPCASLKNVAGILPVCRSLFALVGRKQTVVRDHISPQNPPGSLL